MKYVPILTNPQLLGEFCSMQEITERYKRHTKDRVQPENQPGAQHMQVDSSSVG